MFDVAFSHAMWPSCSQDRSCVLMDLSHVVIAVGGAIAGWWCFSPREQPRVEPSACHCVCSVKPESGGGSNDSLFIIGALGLVIVLLGANLFLALKVTVRNLDGGDREYSVSIKGKAGKGVYGAPKGLQLLDR